MIRKLSAVLSALAVALCFSRAGAWAASSRHGDAHACCHGASPVKTVTLNDCCAPAAMAAPARIVRADAPAILIVLPALPAAPVVNACVPQTAAPPGVRTYRAAVPARAPPRA